MENKITFRDLSFALKVIIAASGVIVSLNVLAFLVVFIYTLLLL